VPNYHQNMLEMLAFSIPLVKVFCIFTGRIFTYFIYLIILVCACAVFRKCCRQTEKKSKSFAPTRTHRAPTRTHRAPTRPHRKVPIPLPYSLPKEKCCGKPLGSHGCGVEGIFIVCGDRKSGISCKVVLADKAGLVGTFETRPVSEEDCLKLLPGDRVQFCGFNKTWSRVQESSYRNNHYHSPQRRLVSTDLKQTKTQYFNGLLDFDFPVPVILLICDYISSYYLPEYGENVTLSVQSARELAYFSAIIPHRVNANTLTQYLGKPGTVEVTYADGAAVVRFENGARILVPTLTLTPYLGDVSIKEKKKKKKKKVRPKRKWIFYRDELGKMQVDTELIVNPIRKRKMKSRRSG